MGKYFCYIIECADGSFYTGWTGNPSRRLRQHNAGTGSRYTRSRRPVRLVYLEEQADRKTAMRREIKLKRLSRRGKMDLIAQIAQASQKRLCSEEPDDR